MKNAPNRKRLAKRFAECSKELKTFFKEDVFLRLIEGTNPLEVALAYLFLQTETAQNRTLYGGLLKKHRAHKDIARKMIESHRLTREEFPKFYKNILGEDLPNGIAGKLKQAEKIRDKVVHGKSFVIGENNWEPQIREAICDVLEYAEQMNSHLQEIAGFQPFASMRGITGARTPLNKTTTRWLLKGMGFAAS